MRRALIAILVVAAVATGGWFGYQRIAVSRSGQAPDFEVVNIVRGNITSTVSATGKVLGEREANLGFLSAGSIGRIHVAVGDRVAVAWISGTDFGSQNACFISPRAFRTLYKPFYARVNAWVHAHTPWKTFIHTCGSIQPLIPDIIEAGFDILNPVQTSAANMAPADLKARFGDRITFWGGGVDTQHTLPFGTPDEVAAQVRERLEIFGQGGGFVFSTIHNVQASVPVANLLAMYETVREWRGY